MDPIYLDFNASTPVLPEVIDAMQPWLTRWHANPHADHFHGHRAAAAVEAAKHAIGSCIGAEGEDIILTSGATESNNLAIQGYFTGREKDGVFVHSAVEHKAVVEIGVALKRRGLEVVQLPVNRFGKLNLAELRSFVDSHAHRRLLLSVMHANNEIGSITPLREVAEALLGSGAILHTDAAQTAGRLSVDVSGEGVDMLTMSSHKIGGPPGIAALYVARDLRTELQPLFFGGGQQDGARPGTVPVFLAVGYGVACEVASRRARQRELHVQTLERLLVDCLRDANVPLELLGDPTSRLPGLLSLRIEGIDAADLRDRIAPFVSLSAGSACASGELRTSPVLRAIGLSEVDGGQVIRVGIDETTLASDIKVAASVISDAVARMRGSAAKMA